MIALWPGIKAANRFLRFAFFVGRFFIFLLQFSG
jgi:hypothetical protein